VIAATDIPRLASVQLRNIRGFDDLRLNFDFADRAAVSTAATSNSAGSVTSSSSSSPDSDQIADPRRSVAVVIGRNGTNKSTLLRSIAVGLASSTDASAMLAGQSGSFVRSGTQSASITIELAFQHGGERVSIEKHLGVDSVGRDMLVSSSGPSAEDLNMLVCAYGAGRGVTGTDPGRAYRVWDGVATLFDYRTPLLSPELTLRRLQDWVGDRAHYDLILAGIARLVGFEDPAASITLTQGGGIQVSAAEVGANVPLEGLADGYRVAFNWIVDLYGRALSRDWVTPDGSVVGLVLIDEIDQHLHPELQSRVVSELERMFPNSNFVVTTHSPLVALGAHPSQLVVLKREQSNVVALDRVPDFRAYGAEDVLTDQRLFATEASNPQFDALLRQRDQMASVDPARRSTDEDDDLRRVAKAIREAPRDASDAQFAEASARFDELLSRRT
jgi:AAA domain, putative AbiEii toxin, Type IV TA system